ncbi:hypothetical protein CC86DRAFT_301900, partial [Ophiobolus disseminans]
VGYMFVAAEMVALLSWLAGWVAVAVNTKDACSQGFRSCKALLVTKFMGTVEWLLFMATANMDSSLVWKGRRQSRTFTV